MSQFNRSTLWVGAALLGYCTHSVAHNFKSVVYDAKTDRLIVEVAYRGTHENHEFLIKWGECRRLDDERSQIYGLLIDSDPTDHARREFSKVLKIDMAIHPCRPSRLTLRTATGFNRSVDIPKPKQVDVKKQPRTAGE